MLYGRCDDLVAALLHGERGQDRCVVGYSRARREDDLVIECRANESLQLSAACFNAGATSTPNACADDALPNCPEKNGSIAATTKG
ncbi:hypothetical protein ACVWZV_008977 [Bradyrhizobium sp. GM5.1]